MKSCKLPTQKQCKDLLDEYRVPEHIRKHCRAVAEYAAELANRFRAAGIEVNTELVEKACLLHDLTRICDIEKLDYSVFERVTDEDKRVWTKLREKYGHLRHEDSAYRILKDDYPELAEVIRRHKYHGIAFADQAPQSWEDKIVYYADKRIMHNRKVSLEERLEDGHRRNRDSRRPKPKGLTCREVDDLIFQLEDEIFSKIELERKRQTSA